MAYNRDFVVKNGLVVLGSGSAQSTSTTTGALVTPGGVGVGGNLHVAGDVVSHGIVLTNFNTSTLVAHTVLADLATTATSAATAYALANTSTTFVGLASNISAYTINQNLGTGNSPTFANLNINGTITATQLTIQLTTITTTLVQTDDVIQTLNTTQSTGTSSGALIIAGGAGIAGNLYAGAVYDNGARVWTTATLTNNNQLTNGAGYLTSATIGGGGVGSITAGTDTAVSGLTGAITIWGTSTLQSVTNRGATTNNAISITNATASSDTTSGALVVNGGVGIGGTVWAEQLRQTSNKVAIGENAGANTQSSYSVAIGPNAGQYSQGIYNVALGLSAGEVDQANGGTALGAYAGQTRQGEYATAVGMSAGSYEQGTESVAIGRNAGNSSQGGRSIAIGLNAGSTNLDNLNGQFTVAIGAYAAETNQNEYGVAIGANAGQTTQGMNAVAVGMLSGQTNQGMRSVAIGPIAGQNDQGEYAVAIGYLAGEVSQSTGTIIINASGIAVNGVSNQQDSLYIAPIRASGASSATNYAIYYNPETKELTTASISSVKSLSVTNNTQSTSTTTGALTVAGGIGIGGNLYVSGSITTLSPIIYDQVATQVGVGSVVLDSFDMTKYRAAKYFVSVSNTSTNKYQASEILLIQDGSSASIEQTSVFSNGDNIIAFSTLIIGSIVYLRGSGTSADNTVKVQPTYITL